jgi:exodeoxyribonuclease V alpha subunit
MKLSTTQNKAVEMAINSGVSILSGYAGTGKTTALKAVIDRLQGRKRNLCCCPTGKAAKRMRECTGVEAVTIHRALEPMIDKNGEFRFTKGPGRFIDADFIIIDETPMVGAGLMASLLAAVDTNRTKILFVGDPGQLPPVTPGAPFRDMIASGRIPQTMLTDVFRNSGGIIQGATSIRNFKIFLPPAEKINLDAGINFRHFEIDEPDQIISMIKQLHEWAKVQGFDPLWDTQVITPTNANNGLSCDGLNAELRFHLVHGDSLKGTPYRIGEKVIQLKNAMLKNADRDDFSTDEIPVVNGDIGIVTDIDDKKIHVTFFDPARDVLVPRKGNDLRHAFAVTCHKMQGSEAPVIIIPIHKSTSFIVNNPWIYTAITRGKAVVFTVGQWGVVERAIGKRGDSRKTFLQEKMV